MEQSLSWVATAATILAASITASNLGSRITGYGFAVFLVGSLCWFAFGMISSQPALMWTNAVLTFLNIFGIWRWLGRQAKIEKGGERAEAASQRSDTPTLFPASLLTKAKVTGATGETLATCVEAMLDCRTGRPAYVVISQGGVAGAGETLRRLPWPEIQVQEDELKTRIDGAQLGDYEALERDNWPAR